MKRATSTRGEFDRFTSFMDRLANVPHAELKAELEAEKAAKAPRVSVKRGKAKPKGDTVRGHHVVKSK
ncbi:MAG: hypothetical protein ACR2JE_16200 [Acidobacteriaceae bacterium]